MKLSLIYLIAFIGLSFFLLAPKNVSAQVLPPEITCNFDFYTVYPGTVSAVPYPYPASINTLPQDIPFSVQLTCIRAGGGASGGTYHVGLANDSSGVFLVDKTINGTGTGTYGTLSNPFGPYPGASAPVYRFFITAEISGQPANVTCQPTSCQFRFGIIPFVLPPPPPSPSPTPPIGSLPCPPSTGTFNAAYRYNPDPPVINQPFQIQFNVPTGGTAGNFNVQYSSQTEPGGTVTLQNVSALGVWVANIPAQSSQFSWQLFGQPVGVSTSRACGSISSTVFNGVGVAGPPGKNPCTGGECETGFGKISTNLGTFATRLLQIALGVAGGLALILMVFGAVRVMTSSGNPQNANTGREIMIAAVAGLLFIAFAVLILQLIGIIIVPIPGLTFGIPI